MSEPIRVLQVLATVNRGGAESRTMDLYRRIDREKIQFDFLLHTNDSGHYEAEILAMGGRIYRLPRFRVVNFFPYLKAIRAFFREHQEFQAVHGHITSTAAFYLPAARKAGIPLTIAHARSAGVDVGLKGRLTRLLRRNLHKRADYLFTCSRLAALSVFGRKAVEMGRTTYIPNMIETERFEYNEAVRAAVRGELGLTGQFVIGHVGRFDYPKNHEYLFKVFCEVQKTVADSRLLLLGGGKGLNKFRALAGEMGIADKVLFMGNVDQVWRYYQAMDYFVFPSRFEGLPGTVIEAQTSGLKCLISAAIAEEVLVTDLVKALSIKDNPAKWAEFILASRDYLRAGRGGEVAAAGFDVRAQAGKLTEFYLSRKKKILLIAPMLHQGGFERVCVTTARLLEPYCEAAIVIFDDADIAFDIKGLNIINIRRGVKAGKLAKLFNLVIRAAKVKKLKRAHHADVAYSFGATANLVNALSQTKTTKVWLSSHSYMDVAEKQKMRLFARKADLFICCSKIIAEEIREKYQCRKAVVLYNPYDVAEMKLSAHSGEPEWPWPPAEDGTSVYLFSMGREDDVKGFWHTIKVFYLVQEKISAAKLIILGAGSFTEYRKLAADLGILASVYFAGMQKEPFLYLKKGTIYLLNSLNEGFPNALVEAMAMGMAAVACDCRSGPAEILLEQNMSETERNRIYREEAALWGEYGVLVPVMDAEKNLDAKVLTAAERNMAAVVTTLLSDPELLKKYREAAAKRAKVFSCESYAEQILTWLRGI